MSLWRSVGWDYTIPLKKKQKVFCKQETKSVLQEKFLTPQSAQTSLVSFRIRDRITGHSNMASIQHNSVRL
uniref:Uncharacterized protein n=1 Tax=Anguilla anguilla TaxID=7936 RepID=A0A0E9QM32_ANGAN